LIFALINVFATSIVTDGVIKFCSKSPANICTTAAASVFHRLRWKIISLPVAGWLATLSIILTVLARGIQLFAKPKKSPETLKSLISQIMINRQQQKLDKETSDYGSQISRGSRSNPSQVNIIIIFFFFNLKFFVLCSLYIAQWIVHPIENFLMNFIHIIILQFLNIVK
jgi:hypothetical protein